MEKLFKSLKGTPQFLELNADYLSIQRFFYNFSRKIIPDAHVYGCLFLPLHLM